MRLLIVQLIDMLVTAGLAALVMLFITKPGPGSTLFKPQTTTQRRRYVASVWTAILLGGVVRILLRDATGPAYWFLVLLAQALMVNYWVQASLIHRVVGYSRLASFWWPAVNWIPVVPWFQLNALGTKCNKRFGDLQAEVFPDGQAETTWEPWQS